MNAFIGASIIMPFSAIAEDKISWREKVERMTPKERERFYKTRTNLKSRIMGMSNEERMHFYNHIDATRGRWGQTPVYVEATKGPEQEVEEAASAAAIEELEKERSHTDGDAKKTMQDWSDMSLEEKQKLLEELSE